jgi:enoyl-CoA hydratase/carnithine racemase
LERIIVPSTPNENQPLLLEKSEGIATITINDAPINRMSVEYMDVLEQVVDELAKDDDVRALIFTGAGDQNFSVGMDLKQLPKAVQARGSLDAVFDQRLRVLSAIENLGKPSIAVLYGYCLGGGLELPLACHFRVAAEEGCKIGLPEMDLGSVPAWGGSARLTHCIGRDAALDMILRAKKISGPEALRLGLVNEVWPLDQLEDRARDIARELASMPPIAVAGVLRVAVQAEHMTLEQSLAEERRAVLATMGTKDQREGMKAFLEKRKPVFTGE